MKKALLLAATLSVGFYGASAFCGPKPKISKSQLSEDQRQVYQSFLESQTKQGTIPLRLAFRTTPLSLSEYMADCLKDLHLQNLTGAHQTIHVIGPEVAKQSKVTLVDPRHHKISDPQKAIEHGTNVGEAVANGFEAGIWNVSEIAFDSGHQHAIFRYIFYCGSLCGHGGTAVYEKTSNGWTEQTSGKVCIEIIQF